MKSKEDNISVFIQLFERVNQQEALIAQYFSKMQKELGAQNWPLHFQKTKENTKNFPSFVSQPE